ncbi:MAG: polysaccharide biosynthesis tyrosine autokinase [Actinomycetota bacterium]
MNEFQMNDDRPGFQLREYLTILRVRKWWIVLATVLVVGSALAYSLQQTPIYVSEAQVFVDQTALTTDGATEDTLNLETESNLATSPAVAEIAAKDLGDADVVESDPNYVYTLLANLTVEVLPETEILTFQYSSSDRQLAADRAQAFATAYLDYRGGRIRESLLTQQESVRRQIDELRSILTTTTDEIQQESLKGQIVTKQQELALLSAPTETLNVGTVSQPAGVPSKPTSPNHLKTGILGLLAGLPLGAGLAFLRERFDDRLRGRNDLETHAGAAVLAVVPRIHNWKNADDSPVVTMAEPKSAAAEAYKTLRTSVLFASAQRGLETLMVSSANAQEGKSATTANLGVALAQSGKRVILVSADLRKPRLHRFFKAQNGMGLTNVLAGEKNALEVLNWVGVENLRLLPSGPVPGNPAELLGSDAMETLLRELQEAADFVVIDAAPVLPVADAMTLTPLVDAVLFVADARRTTRGSIDQARQQLDQVNARVIGTVLNNFDPSKAGYAHQQYGYDSYRVDEPIVRPRSRVMTWGNRKQS